MGHWVCCLSRFFAHVDGEGIGSQGGFSMADWVFLTEHDSGWPDLLAIEGKEVIFRLYLSAGRWGLGIEERGMK